MASAGPRVFDLRLPPLRLESGEQIDPLVSRGWWMGPSVDEPVLDARTVAVPWDAAERTPRMVRRAADDVQPVASGAEFDRTIPTVLIIHALTGDMRAGGPGGFWETIIGPNRAINTERRRVLCFNNLGSCYGTSGPADAGFPMQPGPRAMPAVITPWDQARTILSALDTLGIDRIALATGGSLGGMILLCLAALAPDRIERIAPMAACESASAWIIGWNHVGREALLMDPGYPDRADRGLELARQIAMLTYRAEPGLDERQGRAMAWGAGWNPSAAYWMQTYLEHQGLKLRQRFHPLAYLAQLGSMDHHDLGREPGTGVIGTWGVDRIRSSVLSVGIASDQLFFPEQMKRLSASLRERGVHVEDATIESPHGHDAFLIEWPQIEALLKRAFAMPAAKRGP